MLARVTLALCLLIPQRVCFAATAFPTEPQIRLSGAVLVPEGAYVLVSPGQSVNARVGTDKIGFEITNSNLQVEKLTGIKLTGLFWLEFRCRWMANGDIQEAYVLLAGPKPHEPSDRMPSGFIAAIDTTRLARLVPADVDIEIQPTLRSLDTGPNMLRPIPVGPYFKFHMYSTGTPPMNATAAQAPTAPTEQFQLVDLPMFSVQVAVGDGTGHGYTGTHVLQEGEVLHVSAKDPRVHYEVSNPQDIFATQGYWVLSLAIVGSDPVLGPVAGWDTFTGGGASFVSLPVAKYTLQILLEPVGGNLKSFACRVGPMVDVQLD